jgi:hypothetical protein
MSERDEIDHLITFCDRGEKSFERLHRAGLAGAVDTVDRLTDVLDDWDFVATLDRLYRRKVIRLIE